MLNRNRLLDFGVGTSEQQKEAARPNELEIDIPLLWCLCDLGLSTSQHPTEPLR